MMDAIRIKHPDLNELSLIRITKNLNSPVQVKPAFGKLMMTAETRLSGSGYIAGRRHNLETVGDFKLLAIRNSENSRIA
jgi:hypothetical protein